MVPFSFAGRAFVATADAALFWPARHALLIADLHLEKASWFASRAGQMLPPYDSLAALARIEALVETTGARALWCLGDSFHDTAGAGRLPAEARTRIAALARRVEWTWIVGNHDSGLGAELGGRVLAEAEVEGIRLRHQAVRGETAPEISGHFHPQMRLTARGRHIARRCFVTDGRRMILPAFGALAGGMAPSHPEILGLMGGAAEALVPIEGQLLRFPLIPDRRALAACDKGRTVARMQQHRGNA